MEMCGDWSLVFFGMMAAAKLGCRSSCTRSKSQLTRGKLREQNCQHEVYNLNFVFQTFTALSGVPRSNSFGKQLRRVVSSCVFGEVGKCENFPFFFGSISNVLHVDLFLVGVQFSRSMHFCWKEMRLPCLISWDLQNPMFHGFHEI